MRTKRSKESTDYGATGEQGSGPDEAFEEIIGK